MTLDRFGGNSRRNHFRTVELFNAGLRLLRVFSDFSLRICQRFFITAHAFGDQIIQLLLQ